MYNVVYNKTNALTSTLTLPVSLTLALALTLSSMQEYFRSFPSKFCARFGSVYKRFCEFRCISRGSTLIVLSADVGTGLESCAVSRTDADLVQNPPRCGLRKWHHFDLSLGKDKNISAFSVYDFFPWAQARKSA